MFPGLRGSATSEHKTPFARVCPHPKFMKVCRIGFACSTRKDLCVAKIRTFAFRWFKYSRSVDDGSRRSLSYANPKADVRVSRISLDLQDPESRPAHAKHPALHFGNVLVNLGSLAVNRGVTLLFYQRAFNHRKLDSVHTDSA